MEGRGNSFANGSNYANGPLQLVKNGQCAGWTVQSGTHWDLTTEPALAGLA